MWWFDDNIDGLICPQITFSQNNQYKNIWLHGKLKKAEGKSWEKLDPTYMQNMCKITDFESYFFHKIGKGIYV